MDDVFDTTGRPPTGWMNAIFYDGPYEDNVGRCVPGPPPLDPLEITDVATEPWVYRLVVIGSWSDPMNPIAHYAKELPDDNETGWWADRDPGDR